MHRKKRLFSLFYEEATAMIWIIAFMTWDYNIEGDNPYCRLNVLTQNGHKNTGQVKLFVLNYFYKSKYRCSGVESSNNDDFIIVSKRRK